MQAPIDTRKGIFERKFLCRVSNLATMSVEYIRRLGMPVSGLPEYDQAIRDEIIDRYLTINDMIRYYRQGISMSVVRYSDTEIIYQCIQDHLLAWKEDITTSYSAEHAPIDDLVDLDKFANIVYDKAKYVFDRKFIGDHFERALGDLFDVGISGIDFEDIKLERTVDPITGEVDDGYEKRDSLEELFLSRLR